MARQTKVYLRGALTGPADQAEAQSVDLGFNEQAATALDLGADAHVYVGEGGALIVETGPLQTPVGGYLHKRTFPAWRIIEVAETA